MVVLLLFHKQTLLLEFVIFTYLHRLRLASLKLLLFGMLVQQFLTQQSQQIQSLLLLIR
jgi:hypothetical protein